MFHLDTPIERIRHSDLEGWNGELWIKRDDLIHPEVSGNKWRKLKGFIENMQASGREGLLTFGGAYSNHIAATASAGRILGLRTVGIIRGDELNESSNETLRNAHQDGMELLFVSRDEYALKTDFDYKKQLRLELGNLELIPEGGAGFYGLLGCQTIPEGHGEVDTFVVPCGTGTTLAGMLIGLEEHQKAIGVSVLKGGGMAASVEQLLMSYFQEASVLPDYTAQMELWQDEHLGGYAKTPTDYLQFLTDFYHQTDLKLDPIYTGKMMYALLNKIKKEKKFSDQKIMAIHTGGLQAVKGIEDRYSITLYPKS